MTKTSGQACRVRHHARNQSALDLFNALTHPELLDFLEARLPAHRGRRFPPTETLSMWLAQVLGADGSCQYAVDQAATMRLLSGLPLCSTATGGYCQARNRLPLSLACDLTDFVGRCREAQTPSAEITNYGDR